MPPLIENGEVKGLVLDIGDWSLKFEHYDAFDIKSMWLIKMIYINIDN